MAQVIQTIHNALGLGAEAKDLTFLQMSLRGIIVFVASILMIRVGSKRFLAKMSAFDAVLGFILASMLARAVNGTSAFFPTLGAGFVLMALHGLFARLAFRYGKFGTLVKGTAQTVAKNGKLDRGKMRHEQISEADILEEARLHGSVEKLEDIKVATLERSGQISVVPKE